MASSSRLSSLDGLRGVAALIVVIHHSLLVSPALAAAYYGGDIEGTWHRIAVYSPLHLVWGGKEAVVVFFVLSGLVLVFATRSRSFDWFSYFPSRLLRLYLPVAGAVVVGALIMAIPVGAGPDSPWLDRDAGYPLAAILKDLTLVGGNSHVISPLWTLRWEIIFSLLLPVAAYALRLIPAWAFGALCVGLSVLGAAQGVDALRYLPIFGVGVALAGEWSRIERGVERMSTRTASWAWPAISAGALLLLSSYWMLYSLLPYTTALTLSQAPVLLGAVALVIAASQWKPLVRVLTWRWIALLGAISFSLYLVHEPIVIAIAHLTDSARMTLLLAVPAALVVAWLFWLVVERPAHKLARKVKDHARRSEGARRPASDRHVADTRTRPTPTLERMPSGR